MSAACADLLCRLIALPMARVYPQLIVQSAEFPRDKLGCWAVAGIPTQFIVLKDPVNRGHPAPILMIPYVALARL
ncbi:MAG: hypothetical protein ACXV5N_10925 [Halobacteriota archaeon]